MHLTSVLFVEPAFPESPLPVPPGTEGAEPADMFRALLAAIEVHGVTPDGTPDSESEEADAAPLTETAALETSADSPKPHAAPVQIPWMMASSLFPSAALQASSQPPKHMLDRASSDAERSHMPAQPAIPRTSLSELAIAVDVPATAGEAASEAVAANTPQWRSMTPDPQPEPPTGRHPRPTEERAREIDGFGSTREFLYEGPAPQWPPVLHVPTQQGQSAPTAGTATPGLDNPAPTRTLVIGHAASPAMTTTDAAASSPGASFDAFSGVIQHAATTSEPTPDVTPLRPTPVRAEAQRSTATSVEPSEPAVEARSITPEHLEAPALRSYAPPEPRRETTAPPAVAPPRPVHAPAEPQQPTNTPLRTLSVSVPGEDNTRTDIRFVQRNGALNMDVRTSHPHVAQNLREQLPDLMRSLEASGYRSDLRPMGMVTTTVQESHGPAVRTNIGLAANSFGDEENREQRHSAADEEQNHRRSQRQRERDNDDD